MKQKGMSQTLALIVAATVLLMAALAVIFLTSTTIGDFGKSSRGQGCIRTIQTQCGIQGGSGNISVPGTCTTDGQKIQALRNKAYTFTGPGNEKIRCTSVVN